MERSVWAVTAATFMLRFATGLTGALLIFFLADLPEHGGPEVGPFSVGVFTALFFLAELVLSPPFGLLSDRLGHHRVMQVGPIFGLVAVLLTALTAELHLPGSVVLAIPILVGSLPLIGLTRVLEGASTAASVPSVLGFVAAVTSGDEALRGRASARFEAATIGGLALGFASAGPVWTVLGPWGFVANAGIYAIAFGIYRYLVPDSEEQVDGTRAAPPPQLAAPPPVDRIRAAPPPQLAAPLPVAAALPPDLADPPPAVASPHHAPEARGWHRYRILLRHSRVWLLAPTWIALNAALGLYTSQTLFQLVRTPDPRFADQALVGRFDPLMVAVAFLAGGVVFFAGLIYWGGRFARYRRTTIIFWGIAGGVVFVVAALVLNHAAEAGVLSTSLLLTGLGAGLFLIAGATPAALGLLADISESFPWDRGAVMGLYSVFLGLGQIIGAFIGALAAELWAFDGILVATLVLLGIALLPLARLRRWEFEFEPSPAMGPGAEAIAAARLGVEDEGAGG